MRRMALSFGWLLAGACSVSPAKPAPAQAPAPAPAPAPIAAAEFEGHACMPGMEDKHLIPDTFPVKVNNEVVVEDGVAAGGERWKTLLFKDFLIDKKYPSMRGPWNRWYLIFDPSFRTKTFYVTRYRA